MKNREQYSILKTALDFLHVEELKVICTGLSIPDKGKKGQIILRILHFIETGTIITEPKIPNVSLAKLGQEYDLAPNSLILKGAYKNDLLTRNFFKKLIGSYFHFTAFGIDWINEKWLAGMPPTYQEFADMWVGEYKRRKSEGSCPKTEWAYINFVQNFIKINPNTTKDRILKAWEAKRIKQKEIVNDILRRVIAKY